MNPGTNEKTKNRRKLWWIAGGAFLLLLCVPLALIATAPSDAERRLAELRAAGLPASPAELNAWYPKAPDSNNAALVVLEAIEQRVPPPPDLSTLAFPKGGEPLSAQTREIIAEHVEANEATLQTLHRAALLSDSRYPIDLSLGANALLPHLARVKAMANLLRYETIHHSLAGNRNRAVRSVVSSFALAHTLRDEPTLISELVRIASVAISINSLEFLLAEHALEKEQLETLSKVLKQAETDGPHAAFRAIRGEGAGAITFFGMAGADVHQQLGLPTGGSRPPAKIAFNAYQFLGFADRDLRIYLEISGALAAAVTNPFPKAFQMTRAIERDLDQRLSSGLGRFAMLSRGVLPSLIKAVKKEASLATSLRCARTAVAIERYRRDHADEIPPDLGVLVPGYLSEPLHDPVEGQPLRYEPRSGGGYQISSPIAAAELQNKRDTLFTVRR